MELDFAREAARYEHAVALFAVDGEEAALWEDLTVIGFDADEVQWHVDNRGQRVAIGYVA